MTEAFKRLDKIKNGNKDLVYKDEETGHVLFGQAMLEKHTEALEKNFNETKLLNRLFMVFLVLFLILLVVGVYLIKYEHFLYYAGRQFMGG